VIAQAELIAYNQIREIEEFKLKAAFAGVKV
jgi:hypothetical protein